MFYFLLQYIQSDAASVSLCLQHSHTVVKEMNENNATMLENWADV